MNKIFSSASKLVFILMALASVAATFLKVITGEQFLLLASMAFSFYFSNKGDNSQQFAGK